MNKNTTIKFSKFRKLQKSIYSTFPTNSQNLKRGERIFRKAVFSVAVPCTTVDLRETEVAPREPTEY